MKAICIFNTGKAYKDHEMPVGYSEQSQFPLQIGKEYLIMGIAIWQKQIHFLVDENKIPNWFPRHLFEISDASINNEWFLKCFNKSESEYLDILIGYKELCMVDGYYEQLLDKQQHAVDIYFQRKNDK